MCQFFSFGTPWPRTGEAVIKAIAIAITTSRENLRMGRLLLPRWHAGSRTGRSRQWLSANRASAGRFARRSLPQSRDGALSAPRMSMPQAIVGAAVHREERRRILWLTPGSGGGVLLV